MRKPLIFNRVAVLFILLTACSPQRASFALDLPSKEDAGPVQIKGDTVEYFHEKQQAVGTGHVTIDHQGTRLEADKITVYTESKKAVAEGNVVLTDKGSTYKGRRAEYDFAKMSGTVDQLTMDIEGTYFGKAATVERVSEDHFRVKNASVTTCCCDEEAPFYKVQSQQLDYYPNEKVAMRNAIMYIKNVPVFFLPYWEMPFVEYNRLPVHVVPGMRDEWGPFLLSKWRYSLVSRPDLKVKGNVLGDYRDKRGFGGGAEAFYNGEKVGHGAVRGYYASDEDAPENINDDRGRMQWRHQSKLTPDTTLTAEFNKLTDPEIMKDFFYRDEYERDVVPDNYISIIQSKPEYTLSFLERPRVNDFFETVERNPEIRFDTHNRQLFETPFYFRSEEQFSNLQRTRPEAEDEIDVVRFDTNQTLTYAGHAGPLSVTPHVGTRQTYYSRSRDEDDELVRGVFDTGVDLSIHFYKTYEAYTRAMGLDINRIRHIFTPTASYNYRPTPTKSATLLGQFDALDAIDKDNFVRLNFQNTFQTKEHTRSKDAEGKLQESADATVVREIARIIPFFDVDLKTGHLENVGIDTELRPYSWLGIEADATYNVDTRDIDTANFDVFWTLGRWRVGVGQRYVQDFSSQNTVDAQFKLNDEWQFRVYDRFEFENNESKEFEFTVSKTWSCVITDFTYNHKGQDENEEDTFFFTLRLKAFPEVPFRLSQSYDRPKAGELRS